MALANTPNSRVENGRSEVRTERQNSAGPQQRLTRVAVPGNAEAAGASFGPLLSRGFFEPQKNVRGRLGNLPSAQDEWLSTGSLSLALFLPSPSKPPSSTRRGEAENGDSLTSSSSSPESP
ncbi:hypothetical protein EYF80_045359 [Liparis tanakae]|uniref:Uncharacterized protein n=1 Tax=Liparis tanakae TaxID=230148 RepID=A0A4Z2FUB8_9TELE|nr:hypothetical protein EYF80_045359 [Liparis tanakae]